MSYRGRRSHQLPLLSAKSRKMRLQFTQANQTTDSRKNIAWSDELWFLLQGLNSRVNIWQKEPILPCNQIGIVEVLQPTWVLLLTMSIPLWQQCTHCLCCKVQIIWNWFSSILHWVRCTKFGLHSHQISLAHYICFSVNSRCVTLKACCLWNTTMSPGAGKILWGHRAHINCL